MSDWTHVVRRDTCGRVLPWSRWAVGGVLSLGIVREAGAGHWVTIEDDEGLTTHLFIGQGGLVTKGPKHLIGANIKHLPPSPGRYSSTHHAEGHTPQGHDTHPHYTEHQDKTRVYGKHGPGHGYLVANPLRELTEEEAHKGRDAAFGVLREQQGAKQDAADRAAAEQLAQAGSRRGQAEGALGVKAIQKHLKGYAQTPEAKKALKTILSEHKTPLEQALALAHGAHQWSSGFDPDADPNYRTSVAGLMSLPWTSESYQQAHRLVRDLTKEKGALPTQQELREYVRHGIARKVGPHFAAAVAKRLGTEGASEEQQQAAKESIGREDTVHGQIVAAMKARAALTPESKGYSSNDLLDIWHGVHGSGASQAAQNALAEAYASARRDVTMYQDDTGKLPRSGAAVELYHEKHHDAPLGTAARWAYFTGRAFRRTFAAADPDPPIPVQAGKLAAVHGQQAERQARAVDAASALPAFYRKIYRALDNDVTVHGGSYLDVHPDQGDYVHGQTGAKASGIAGTYDGTTSNVYTLNPHNIANVVRHEIGHGIDRGVGQLRGTLGHDPLSPTGSFSGPDSTLRSHQPDFVALWKKNRKNDKLWDYMRTTPGELFAEGFNRYHHDNPKMRDVFREDAPDVAVFFDGLEKEVAGYGPPAD